MGTFHRKSDGQEKIYTILGSSETNPGYGVISHHSPIGAALLGRSIGDTITLTINNKQKIIKIISIK